MGFFSRLLKLSKVALTPDYEFLPAPLIDGLDDDFEHLSVEELWREQPHLRTVTTFIARNVASISLHVYKRSSDGGRERIRDGVLPKLMQKANPSQTMQQLLLDSIMDLCLYDEFIWIVGDENEEWEIYPISPTWVTKKEYKNPWELQKLTFTYGGEPIEIDARNIIRVHGYRPGTYKKGTSPVTALKDTLREQLEAASYRSQLWQRGPRINGVIERPVGTPWDDVARRRFKRAWQGQYSGRGSGAGGTPILEDGMKFSPFHLSADDEQIVDVAKLSLATVASVYHVNPTMVGLLDNANYSNVKEFRKSLYGDSLGPIIKQVEDTINFFLLPTMGIDDGQTYVEFNLDEKLRASFEEKAQVTSTAVGTAWMTVNEARAMNNLPAIPEGDDLVRPLNMDTADPNDQEDAEQQVKPDETEAETETVGDNTNET